MISPVVSKDPYRHYKLYIWRIAFSSNFEDLVRGEADGTRIRELQRLDTHPSELSSICLRAQNEIQTKHTFANYPYHKRTKYH